MNFSTIRSHIDQFQNSFVSLLHRIGNSCTSQRCQVHPEIGSNHSLDFIDLGSKRIVRILHIYPKSPSRNLKPSTSTAQDKSIACKRTSLHLDISSEEYWFTRANRPYRQCDDCNRNPRPYRNNDFADTYENIGPDYSTNGNNQMTALDGGSLSDFGKINTKLLDSYAESLSNEVISEVFRHIFCNFPKGIYSASKDTSETNLPAGDRFSELDGFNNGIIQRDTSRNADTPNLLINSLEASTGVTSLDQPFHSCDQEIIDTFRPCKSGIINLSFSGSLSEPDEITSSGNDYLQVFDGSLVSSPPNQYKFEVSNSFKRRSLDIPSERNNKSNELSVGVRASSHEPIVEPVVESLLVSGKSPISKEDFGNETMTLGDQGGESINSVNTSLLNVHDPKSQVLNDNGRVGPDSCVHTKNTQKPLLLFLHGVGSSADVWSVMLEYFSAAGYEVLAPDMLGHGYSSAPNNRAAYTFDRLLQDVLQIFDRFVSDNQKCVAIGHSYGSCFAAALARYRSQQISQLVLLSSGGPSPLVPKQTLFSLHPCVVSLMRPFLMCGFKREVFYAPRGKQLPSFCTYELPRYVMNHVERGQDWSDGDSAFHRRILVPTLLVHGLKDPYISLVEECEMERTIPRSFLEVLPNAGHMQMLDAPEQLCHMIHCFITWWNS